MYDCAVAEMLCATEDSRPDGTAHCAAKQSSRHWFQHTIVVTRGEQVTACGRNSNAGMTGAEPTVARLGTDLKVRFTLTLGTYLKELLCLAISTPVGRIGGQSFEGCQDTRLLCGDVAESKQ
jgi:hypothetical protein